MERLRGNKAILLIWLGVSLLLVITAIQPIMSGIGLGPDDQLRQVQIRDWLAGQSWFDTTQYRIGIPDSQPMHWPRLIEIPFAAIILILTPLVGGSVAEIIAMTLVPLVLLGAAIWLIFKIAGEVFEEKTAILAAALTATAVPVVIQLRPMRIDHHGWQVVLALLALWTIYWPNVKRAGIALGLTLALLLSISLEGLPLAVGFMAFLAIRWVFDKNESARLFWTLSSLIGGISVLFLLTQGHFNTALNYCDAVSPIHIVAAVVGGLIILPVSYRNADTIAVRVMTLLFGGAAALATILMIEPKCTAGAFGQIDPLVRQYWLTNVAEGLPIWQQKLKTAVGLFGGSILIGLLTFAYLHRKTGQNIDRNKLIILGTALVFAILVSIFVQRASATAAAFSVPLMAWAVRQWFIRAREVQNFLPRVLASAAVILLVLPGPIAIAAYDRIQYIAQNESEASAKIGETQIVCDAPESLAKLNSLPRTDIAAPFNLGPRILLLTPHSVLASSHHRNDEAMADQIRIFVSKPDVSRKILAERDIKYLAVCPEEEELGIYETLYPQGLWAKLASDAHPDWLQPVHLRDSGLKVWRIVKN